MKLGTLFYLKVISLPIVMLIFFIILWDAEYLFSDVSTRRIWVSVIIGVGSGVISAGLYYWITDGAIDVQRNKLARGFIESKITDLHELADKIKFQPFGPFLLLKDQNYRAWDKSRYIKEFDQIDLNEKIDKDSMAQKLERYQELIFEISNNLLLNYFPYLTFHEIKNLNIIVEKYNRHHQLYPKVFGMIKEYYISGCDDNNNQAEYGKGIYELYLIIKSL